MLVLIASRPTASLAPEYTQLLAEPGAALLDLTPLGDEDALELACDRLGAVSLAPEVEELILDRAAGNPLFVEEIAAALRDAQLVEVAAGGVCTVSAGADLGDLGLPDTVEGVIANRMEGLEPRVDMALKVASVVGRTFPSQLVHEVYPVAAEPRELDGCLETLVRRDLTHVLQPPPATSYAFHQVLVRDVAYGRMLYGQRRELHRAIGEWHEARFADNLAPVYAMLAHHYTQAGGRRAGVRLPRPRVGPGDQQRDGPRGRRPRAGGGAHARRRPAARAAGDPGRDRGATGRDRGADGGALDREPRRPGAGDRPGQGGRDRRAAPDRPGRVHQPADRPVRADRARGLPARRSRRAPRPTRRA